MGEYHSDYPTVPTEDSNNPYYMCAHCGRTDPQINGEIKNHAEWCEYRIKKETEDDMTDSAQENLNSKRLARNIRHRLADMLGSQWTGALDAAMDEMLLDEIDKFSIIQIPIRDDDGDPYLKGIMERD